MTSPSLTLIVSTYNNLRALDRVLGSVAAGTRMPDELVVCDDGSGPETRALIEQWAGRASFPIIHAWQEDKGFRKGRALNLSLARSQADYVVLLDGDCIPSHRFVEDHVRLAEPGYFVQGRRAFIAEQAVPDYLDGKVGLVSLALRGQLGGLFKAIRWPRPVIKVNREMRGIIGCNLGIWRRDFEEINGFDEDYEGWGIGDDSDVGARLYHKGLQRKFVYGRALVYHLNHPCLSREHVETNAGKLQRTIDSCKIRCERGLSQHTDHHV
jgi:glycosyltransferase involved in cell wall biosynthesis